MDSNMLGSITSSNHQATLATLHRHGPIKSTSWSPFAPKTGLAIGWVDQVRQCAQGGWDLCSGESKIFSFWILDIFLICLDYLLVSFFSLEVFVGWCFLVFFADQRFHMREGITLLGWPGKTVLDENIATWRVWFCWMIKKRCIKQNQRWIRNSSWKIMIHYESLNLVEIASQESPILKIPY